MIIKPLKINILKEVGAFIFLLIICLFTSSNLEYKTDLELADEAYYMYQGVTLFKDGLTCDWGPLYSLWYKVLHLFESDRVLLYYLNMAALSSLPTFSIYFFLRIFRAGIPLALFFAILFHFSIVNYPQGGKVSIFALIFLIVGVSLIYKYAKSNLSLSLSLISVLMFLIAYIRPENTVTCGIAIAINVLVIIYLKKPPFYLIASVAFVATLILMVGNPNSTRGELAFKQQFGYHYIMRHPEDIRFTGLDAWIDFDEVIFTIFGQDVKSFYEAFLLRGTFIIHEHFIPNIYTFSGMLYDLLLDYLTIFKSNFLNLIIYSSLGVSLIILYAIGHIKFQLAGLKFFLKKYYLIIYPVLLFSIVVTLASFYSLANNTRYLPVYYILFPVVILFFLSGFKFHSEKANVLRTIIGGTLLCLLLMKSLVQIPIRTTEPEKPLVGKEFVESTVRFAGDYSKNTVLFSNRDQVFCYLGGTPVGYKDYVFNEGFSKFVEERGIDLFAFRKNEVEYFSQDESFVDFIENPGEDFIKEIDNRYGFVFIKRKPQ